MNAESLPLCSHLDWDTRFFGKRIARLHPERITEALLHKAWEWCEKESIECLYFLATMDDPQTVAIAERHGFQLMDIRLTFEHRLEIVAGPPKMIDSLRLNLPRDLPALKVIARASHTDSRFYADGHFLRDRCAALYETWIERSCLGWARAVWVLEMEDEPMGYVTCHLDEHGAGSIGLIGVSQRAQGQGCGRALVDAALNWFRSQGAQRVTVVTQGRNVRAQRLYQHAGFRTITVQLWYHRWFA